MSRPDFLARDDLPPVRLPVQQVPPPLAISLQQVPLEATVAAEEEIASSWLSLEEEIDQFHFTEDERVSEKPVEILDFETKSDKLSSVRPQKLIVAQIDSSSEEEEGTMDLRKGSSLKGLLDNRNKGTPSKQASKS